jgi:hypothetical protein
MSRHDPPLNPCATALARHQARAHLKPRRSTGQCRTDCAGDHDQRKNNDDDGCMTPSFYRARLWPNRSRISAKVGVAAAHPPCAYMVNRTPVLSLKTWNYMQSSVFKCSAHE